MNLRIRMDVLKYKTKNTRRNLTTATTRLIHENATYGPTWCDNCI